MIRVQVNFTETIREHLPPDIESLLGLAAEAALVQQQVVEGELTILVADDDMLAGLNQAYRGITTPTDVLSFPAGESPAVPGMPPYLGDIALSLPRAQAQAVAGGHTLVQELQLLVVHGTLHLLGHDHAEPEEKARMWAAQAEVLRRLEVPLDILD